MLPPMKGISGSLPDPPPAAVSPVCVRARACVRACVRSRVRSVHYSLLLCLLSRLEEEKQQVSSLSNFCLQEMREVRDGKDRLWRQGHLLVRPRRHQLRLPRFVLAVS